MTRSERAGIEFPDATWTTFDRYDRYGAIARCLRASLGPGRHRVLDVGDAAGYLPYFTGDLALVGVDVAVQPDRLEGSVAIAADGARLPFPDRSFDAVVTSDVLEHVPAPARPAFVRELSRVSRDLVIVAAPFDTAGVAGVEELLRRYVLLVTGAPQEQLEEHRECGLPDLDGAAEALGEHGAVAVAGNGNLWDWLELMLVKHQLLARQALQPLHDGIDLLANLSLAGQASEPPYYRHLLAARRGQQVDLGRTPDPPVSRERASAVIRSLLVAAGPESTRQDLYPVLDAVFQRTGGFDLLPKRDEVLGALDRVEARVQAIDAQMATIRRQYDRVHALLEKFRSPLRRARSGDRSRDDAGS
jgi:SAM-dependent methyltransferase